MTQEDDCSVYVGGLAYDSTEDTLQKAFSTYGDISTIKIVYDRESGQSRGFGFVTFTNPRSAAKAISGLDGELIGGRNIRVNEVKKNSGKTLNRDGSFRDRSGKHRDGNRRSRNFSPHRHRYSSPFGRRSTQIHSPEGSPGRSRSRSPGRGRSNRLLSPRSRSPQADRSGSVNSSSGGRPRGLSSRSSQSPQSSDRSFRRAEERTHRTSASSKALMEKQNDFAKVREELEKAVQSRQELQEKVSNLTSKVEQAKGTVSALQIKSQKLEEALSSTLSSAAHRRQQLKKLQRGILQVRDSSERLKKQEKELKVLMDATFVELDGMDGDGDDRLVSLRNGTLFDNDAKVENAS